MELNVKKTKGNVNLNMVVNTKEIQKGKYKKVDMDMLLALASFMDTNGVCCPTQEQLAEIMGVSISTIYRKVNNLLNVEIDGQHIVTRELKQTTGCKKASFYTFLPLVNKSPVYTAKSVIDYFCATYFKVYKVKYTVGNGGVAGNLIKTKLLPNYTQEQIENTINYVMEHYQSKWATKQYPRPTIGMLCGWLFNIAQEFIQDVSIEEEDLNKIYEDLDKVMDEL